MSLNLPQPSGSAKIYATASSDWVIPPKPRPGRKPKVVPQEDLEFENDTTERGKKSQNRSAQRAFRERKQTQLSELQARIKQYEQGEIDRSVTFQTLGIRLKAENESLKEQNRRLSEENELLKARLAEVTQSSATAPGTLHRGLKRGRLDSPSGTAVSLKRLKLTESPHLGVSSLNTPCSSSGHSLSSHGQFKEENEYFMDDRYCSDSPITDSGNIGQDPRVAHDSCGMCTSSVDCICRELGIRAPMNPMLDANEDATMSMFDNRSSIPQPAKVPEPLLTSTNNTSAGCSGNPRDCSACKDSAFGRAFCAALGNSICMLNPCPTCQPTIEPSSSSSPNSEDTVMPPAIINDEPATLPLTINPTLTQCCGDPAQCKGGACSPAGPKTSSRESSRRRRNKPTSQERPPHPTSTPGLAPLKTKTTTTTTRSTQGSDTVSCDIVWKALEAHPNAHLANPIAGPSQLANLNMLADVVARRSYCTLAPGEPTPEPEDFPRRARPRPPPRPRTRTRGQRGANAMDISDGVVVDDHADARVTIAYEDEQKRDVKEPERRMVPLQGHQRITAVPEEGMRDAIALMDQQFGCS